MEENKKDVLPLEGEPLTTLQISEPVVNALAAALNKIETYVPTQYINDGPPDIDAEHLNHAEQAIMRVTNLANGAADAISALQSQVTQLNNNISNFKTFYGISWREYENISLAIESKLRDKVYANGMYFFMAYTKGGSVSMIILSVGIDVSFGIWFNYAGNGKQFKFMNDNYQEYPFISQGIELAGADSAWITKHGMPAGQPPGSR